MLTQALNEVPGLRIIHLAVDTRGLSRRNDVSFWRQTSQRLVSRQSIIFSTVLRSYLPSDARTSVWNNVAPAAR